MPKINLRLIRAGIAIGIVALIVALIALGLTGAGIVAQIDFWEDDVLIAEQQGINLKEGANITIDAVEDATNKRVDYTVSGTGGAAGGFVELARFTTQGGENGVEFTSIPSREFLQIIVMNLSVNVSTTLNVFFNDDTGTNYDSNQIATKYSDGSFIGDGKNNIAGCRIFSGAIPIPSTGNAAFDFIINNPDDTTNKTYTGEFVANVGSGHAGCRWKGASTAEITKIEFVLNDSRTFNADGVFILLGK